MPFVPAPFFLFPRDAAGQSGPVSDGNSTTDGCAATELGDYNLNYHIGSIFIVLAVSSCGIFGTLMLGNARRMTSTAIALQLFKLFGIGVIAGTAWIHLLPDAFSQFGNPCLSGGWENYGTAYVGLFGLIAAFITQILETSAMGHGPEFGDHDHGHKEDLTSVDTKLPPTAASAAQQGQTVSADDCVVVHPDAEAADSNLTVATVIRNSMVATTSAPVPPSKTAIDAAHSHASRRHLSTTVLEAGIIFHSLVIGLTLGVTTDDAFSGLLAAICFHQLFEGMALGALIGDLQEKTLAARAGLAVLYPISTPIGIVIGIAVRNSFNENAQSLILLQGILDSLSAGILMYNTYTELMSVEIVHNPQFRHYSKHFKVLCYLVLYSGAAAMAVVGIWA